MKTYSTLFECRKVTLPVFVVIFCGFLQHASFNQKDFETLAPITGTWVTKRTNGDIYETWKRSGSKEFAGMSFALAGADTTPLEKVRLYITGTDIIYEPTAIGQNDDKEVLFKLKSMAGRRFVFENLQHDFPKRIVYDFRAKDSLYAHIEGEVNGQQRRVDYPYKRIK